MLDGGEGQPKKQLKRSFDMVRLRAAERGGSKGSAQGVEELTRAFADGFAAQVASQQDAQLNTQQSLMALIEKQGEFGLIRLQESTQFTAQINALQQQLHRAEVELALANQSSVLTPELIGSLVPGVVGLLHAGAARLMGAGPQLEAKPKAE